MRVNKIFTTTIGLEVHIELRTESKMFCNCPTAFGAEPNSNTCPVCLGLPGVLPVINKKAVEMLIKTAIALNCKIADYSKFDRKNYFYPDMPKNYQISQYDFPLAYSGFLEIEPEEGPKKRIGIIRIHLEEDTGKSIHTGDIDKSLYTLEDFNRAGIPLLEIVTAPDISSPGEAYLYLNDLKNIIQYLGVSDCKMEEGSLRCDANISVSIGGKQTPKIEVKNMNSFKAVEKALAYEESRLVSALENGEQIEQHTRGWLEKEEKTIFMRGKEFAHDYRYFPEPDLPPLVITKEEIEKIKKSIPELPYQRRERYIKDFGLSHYDTALLVENKELGDFLEQTLKFFNNPKKICNWLLGDISRILNKNNTSITQQLLTPANLAMMLNLIEEEVISGKMAKELIEEMVIKGTPVETLIKKQNLQQIKDEESLKKVITEVIKENPDSVNKILSGKTKVKGFLVGEIMKKTEGKANPQLVNKILDKTLGGL